jgi:hypothetical protein
MIMTRMFKFMDTGYYGLERPGTETPAFPLRLRTGHRLGPISCQSIPRGVT